VCVCVCVFPFSFCVFCSQALADAPSEDLELYETKPPANSACLQTASPQRLSFLHPLSASLSARSVSSDADQSDEVGPISAGPTPRDPTGFAPRAALDRGVVIPSLAINVAVHSRPVRLPPWIRKRRRKPTGVTAFATLSTPPGGTVVDQHVLSPVSSHNEQIHGSAATPASVWEHGARVDIIVDNISIPPIASTDVTTISTPLRLIVATNNSPGSTPFVTPYLSRAHQPSAGDKDDGSDTFYDCLPVVTRPKFTPRGTPVQRFPRSAAPPPASPWARLDSVTAKLASIRASIQPRVESSRLTPRLRAFDLPPPIAGGQTSSPRFKTTPRTPRSSLLATVAETTVSSSVSSQVSTSGPSSLLPLPPRPVAVAAPSSTSAATGIPESESTASSLSADELIARILGGLSSQTSSSRSAVHVMVPINIDVHGPFLPIPATGSATSSPQLWTNDDIDGHLGHDELPTRTLVMDSVLGL
jgi:hypothetical protein